MSEVGGWTNTIESLLVFGFLFFFFISKTVWIYMDGLINLVEESYVFPLSEAEYEFFLSCRDSIMIR